MNRSQRIIRRPFRIAFITALILFTLFLIGRPERSLVTKATSSSIELPYGAHYFWLSNHEALILSPQAGDLSLHIRHYSAKRIDMRTGVEVAVPGLEAATGERIDSDFVLSPDSAKLLWNSTRYEPSRISKRFDRYIQHVRQFRLSTKSFSDYKKPFPNYKGYGSTLVWMPDSRRWLSYSVNGTITAHIDSSRKEEQQDIVAVGITNQVLKKAGTVPGNVPGTWQFTVTQSSEILGLLPNGHVLLGYWGTNRIQGGYFTEIDLSPGGSGSRQYQVTMSVPEPVQQILLSPRGERLLWVTESQSYPLSWLRPLGAYFPALRQAPRRMVHVWTSDINGRDRREVGSEEFMPSVLRRGQILPMKWMPDGKHASFVYGADLYTIPVR